MHIYFSLVDGVVVFGTNLHLKCGVLTLEFLDLMKVEKRKMGVASVQTGTGKRDDIA